MNLSCHILQTIFLSFISFILLSLFKGVDVKTEYKSVLVDNAATTNGKEALEMTQNIQS